MPRRPLPRDWSSWTRSNCPGRAARADAARRAKVRGSGNPPVHITPSSTRSTGEASSRSRGVRNGSGLPVEVEARQPGRVARRDEVGVGLAGEDGDLVAERGELAGEVPDVDPLPAAVRVAPVEEKGDPEGCGVPGRSAGRGVGVMAPQPRLRRVEPQAAPGAARGQPIPSQPRTVKTTSAPDMSATTVMATVATTRKTGPLAPSPRTDRRLARTRMKTSRTGATTPSITWVPTSKVMRLIGVSATAAPTTIWAVNSPRKSGASEKRRDTERSTPTASATA